MQCCQSPLVSYSQPTRVRRDNFIVVKGQSLVSQRWSVFAAWSLLTTDFYTVL